MSINSRFLAELSKYTLAAIFVAIPLFPKFPFVNVPGTFVSIRLEDALLAFSGVLVFMHIIKKPKEFLADNLNKAIFLFFAVGLVSLLSGVFLTQSIEAHIGLLHYARRIEYVIPFYLAWLTLNNNNSDLAYFLKVLIAVVVLVFVYGLGQKYLDWPVIVTQNEEYSKGIALRFIPGSHLNSTFAGHYDLGTFLVLVLPILICLLVTIRQNFYRLVLLATCGMGLWLLVNTASRISLVSYLLSACIALFLIRKVKLVPIVVIVSLFFSIFSSNLLLRYQRIIDVVRMRFSDAVSVTVLAQEEDKSVLPQRRVLSVTPTPPPVFEDRSTNIRLNVEWPRALRAFFKNPLLGTGYSSITLATDNDFLRLLGEVGILGFFSFFLIFIRIFNKFLANYPIADNFDGASLAFLAGVFGALPGVFLNAVFIDVFEASKFAIILWLFLGISVSLLNDKKIRKNVKEN